MPFPGEFKDVSTWLLFRGTLMKVVLSQTPGDMWNRKGDERLSITYGIEIMEMF